MRHWITEQMAGWSDGQVFTALFFVLTGCYFAIDITIRRAWRHAVGRLRQR